ncbi:tetraacyldisaccharide 4'-kinase [Variovorax sp. ZT4R33]|uniref:tetraacyldisaccharide 4'-kinase n=1 Tax=Variovorax sp. ZT4R33 TaxID=3443743 RepID=UPI003F45C452
MPLQRIWLERGVIARLLWPLSQLFGALAALRRALYRAGWLRTEQAGVPVVVVGNVVAGGAGKTPVVMAIVEHLRQRGMPVGVISRGYGRRTADCRAVLGTSDPRDVGDEPALVHRSTGAPVFVARRRIDAARALRAAHPEVRVILSDDGLQHLGLARDVEICVFDDRGIGNGWLLPAGPLREAWPRRCDLVLHTGARPAFAGYTAHRALADVAITVDGSRVPLKQLTGRRLIAVAGIARPESFFEMLRAAGLEPGRCVALPDHHDFEDWTLVPSDEATVLCTEKDALKLWHRQPDALAVPLRFTPAPAFLAALDAKLSSLDGHQAS